MHVFMTDGELVEIALSVVDRATQPVLLTGQHIRQVAISAGAVGQVELPARGVRYRARIPQPVGALDQRRAAMGVAQRPEFMEPADMAYFPEHGIDDVQARAHQFGQ
jgi:hypothetical protein